MTERILFATVDRSPHCTQMHYMTHEIERILPEHIPMESWGVIGDQLIRISPETIERSKSLALLERQGGEAEA